MHIEIVLGDVHDHDQYTPEARVEEVPANLEGGYFGSRSVTITKAEQPQNAADDACASAPFLSPGIGQGAGKATSVRKADEAGRS